MRKVLAFIIATTICLSSSSAGAQASTPSLASPTSERARTNFLSFMSHASRATPNATFTIDPLLKKVYSDQIVADIRTNVRMWTNLRSASKPMDVYAAPTQHFLFVYNYMKQVLPAQQLESGWLDAKAERARLEPTGFFGGGAPGDAKNGNAVLMVYVPNGRPTNDDHWNSLTSHEYVHIAQRSVFNGSMAAMQCWVREGQANFIGWSYAGRANKNAYVHAWKSQLQDLENEREYSPQQRLSVKYWENWFIANETQDITKDCDPTQNYVTGAMAFQYLYGTYGYEKVNAFIVGLAAAVAPCGDGTPKFSNTCIPARNSAFEKAFGVSLRDVYPRIAAHIVRELKWFTNK
jgi:hypothetical protein